MHGRFTRFTEGKYGEEEIVGVVTDGAQMGDEAIGQPDPLWLSSVRAETAGVVLVLPWSVVTEFTERVPSLAAHLEAYARRQSLPMNRKGEADVPVQAGHVGEPTINGGYVDYELAPREYELSLTQTVLRVHTRVADLYNNPMDQTEQQLRLTIEEIRERQEWELVNNREFGLLHNADHGQRVNTFTGPPTPDDMDELLAMRRKTKLFLAHPKAIAAFFRQCNRRGLVPGTASVEGHEIPAWRGCRSFPATRSRSARSTPAASSRCAPGRATRGPSGSTRPASPRSTNPA